MFGILVLGILEARQIVPSRLGMNPRVKDLCEEISVAQKDWNYPFVDNFHRSVHFKKDAEIVRGTTGSAVVFIGDSHMQHYWPRIESDLNTLQRNARPIIFITARGCPTLPNVNRVERGFACEKFFDFAIHEAEKPNIGTVVFSCVWERYFMDVHGGEGSAYHIYRVGDNGRMPLKLGSPAARQIFAEFGQVVAKLVGMDKEVVVILSSPSSSILDPKRALSSIERTAFHRAVMNPMRIKRKEFESFVDPLKRALLDVVVANGAKAIDPLDYFEEDGFFNGKSMEGHFRYTDSEHLRPFYVRERASFLDSLIQAKPNGQSEPVQIH